MGRRRPGNLDAPQDPALFARATLLADPWVELAPDLELPVRLSGSKAGPGGGRGALFVAFGGRQVRLNVADRASFRLERVAQGKTGKEAGRYRLLKRGRPFLGDIELVEPLLHAPRMAFINLYSGCDHQCLFCSQPSNLEARVRSVQEIVGMVREALARGRLDSIALTSGICGTPATTNRGLAWATMALSETFPDIPIGVEPYIEAPADIHLFKEAGAAEIKLNVQTATYKLFKVICPALEWHTVWSNLELAVQQFGQGRVQSNLLVGLGEKQEEAIATIDRLCAMGVLLTLRPVRLTGSARRRVGQALGREPDPPTPEELLTLLKAQRAALRRHGLEAAAQESSSMCPNCGGCGLEPHLDR